MGSCMDIKGFNNYCFFCRRDKSIEKVVFDKKLGLYICVWCAKHVKKPEVDPNVLEQRFTPELAKFLVNLCLERSRSCSHNNRFSKQLLCTGKGDNTTRNNIITLLMNQSNHTAVYRFKKQFFPFYIFYYSAEDIFILQKQSGDKKNSYNYFLIGIIEISELLTILR